MMLDFDTNEYCDLFFQLREKYDWKCHIVATDSGIHAIFKKPDLKEVKDGYGRHGIHKQIINVAFILYS